MDKRSVLKYIDENKCRLVNFHQKEIKKKITELDEKKEKVCKEIISKLPEKVKVGKSYIIFNKEDMLRWSTDTDFFKIEDTQLNEIDVMLSSLEKEKDFIWETIMNNTEKLKMEIVLDGMTPELIDKFKNLFINIS